MWGGAVFKPALMAVGGFRHRRSVVCRSFPPTNPPSSSAVPVSMAESILVVHRCPRHSCTLLYIVRVSMAELLYNHCTLSPPSVYIVVHQSNHRCINGWVHTRFLSPFIRDTAAACIGHASLYTYVYLCLYWRCQPLFIFDCMGDIGSNICAFLPVL